MLRRVTDNLAGRRSPKQGQRENAADKCYLPPARSPAKAARTYDTALASLPSHNPTRLMHMEVQIDGLRPPNAWIEQFKSGEGMRNWFHTTCFY